MPTPHTDTLDLTDPATFKAWSRDIVRFGDTDALGHVNNAVYATFFESGRLTVLMPGGKRTAPDGRAWVAAKVELQYRAEVHWPAEIAVGTTVLRLGRSSARFGQGLFVGGTCRATAEVITVMIDTTTRKSAEIPEETRAALMAAVS